MYPVPEWKRRMQVPVSKLELETIGEMGRRGLNRGLETNEPVILWYTKPDLKWPDLKMAVYLDGIKVHSSLRQQEKDERIKLALEDRGWRVLRIRYKQSPGKARKKEIWDEIEAFLRTHEKYTKLFGKE